MNNFCPTFSKYLCNKINKFCSIHLDRLHRNVFLCRLCWCQPQTAFRSSKCLDTWTSWKTSSCAIVAVRNSWPHTDLITPTSVKNSPSASAPVCCTEPYVSQHNVCLNVTKCHLCQVLKYIDNGIICSSIKKKYVFTLKERISNIISVPL